MPLERFGIVGFGHFGSFLADSLKEHGSVVVTDIDATKLPECGNGLRPGSLDEVAKADVVILAVPFSTFEAAVTDLSQHLRDGTVVMDVVSTKAQATSLLEQILDDHPDVLASHPLFGPPSMSHIEPGQRLVVTYEKGSRAAELRGFLADELGLEVLERDPRDHDEAMAYMQALPFFIARALGKLDLPLADPLAIPSYERLASMAAIESYHTDEMFETSQRGNPFAEEVRRKFLEVLHDLDERLRDPDPLEAEFER